MAQGWKCPGCGRCYSLLVTECRACNAKVAARERKPHSLRTYSRDDARRDTYCPPEPVA